jgi:hypothetical protein
MHLPWSAQQYERTCADCGCSWRAPRQLARTRVPSTRVDLYVGGVTVFVHIRPSESPVTNAAVAEQAESLRECPNCGSDQCSQHLVWS